MKINEYLSSDEKIIYGARVSKVSFIASLIVAGVVLIATVALFLIAVFTHNGVLGIFALFGVPSSILLFVLALKDSVYVFSTRAYITNKRVLVRYGWISHRISELPLEKVSGISFNQSLLGRIFNYATTLVESSANVSGIRIKWLKSAFEFKKMLQNQAEQVEV